MSIKNQRSKNFFFSVITPSYNSGEKILRAIKSLENNSISFEHIIIDDCSTDGSFSSVKKLNNDSFNSELVLLNNPSNIGPGASRNKGLDFARGQYIIFLDADDYFLDKALDNIYSVIKSKEEVDVLLFKYNMLVNNKHSLNFPNDLENIALVEEPIREYLLDNIISSPWCKCIESKLAKRFRFPDLRVSEDAIYNLDIFINAKKVLQLNSVLYIFDKTESGSLTRKVFDRKEFISFYNGWIYFEKKALQDLKLKNKLELIASRKIRFSAIYFMSRLAINPNHETDRFIIRFIRNTISKNIVLARSQLNLKVKLLCFIFYFFPFSTIKLLRIYKFI